MSMPLFQMRVLYLPRTVVTRLIATAPLIPQKNGEMIERQQLTRLH